MWKLACLVVFVACAHPTTTTTTCPPLAPAKLDTTTDEVPPPDDQLRRWQATKDRVPEGTTAAKLVPELIAYLGSVDPVRRDGIAYEVFVSWIVKQPKLSPDELRELAAKLEANLAGPLDVRDGVYLRSFSALVLSLIAKRDLDAPVLDDAGRRKLLDAAVAYAGREIDLRGHVGKRGWVHAAAHTADLLKFLARQPGFTDDDRMRVLDGAASLAVRRHGANFHHGEDGRIAVAVLDALKRGVPDDKLVAWVKTLATPLGERETAQFDPALYAAQRNARNLLFTLFVQLSVIEQPSDDARRALEAIRALLAG